MTEKSKALIWGEIVSKCWEDEEYKKNLLANPEKEIEKAGIDLEEGVEIKVIEPEENVQYIVLPVENVREVVQGVAKSLLNKADQSEVIIPEGYEVRLVQNSEDVCYFILPKKPVSLTEAELANIVGGGTHAAETNVQVVAEGEVVCVGVTTVVAVAHGACVLI